METSLEEVAAKWARGLGAPRTFFLRSITATSDEPVGLVRCGWAGENRTIVKCSAPTKSRARRLEDPASPDAYDPWAVDGRGLAASTRRLSACPACEGAKTVTCDVCHGTAASPCGRCHGVGCGRCHGRGWVTCRCRDGVVRCDACDGKGKADTWLEVDDRPFEHQLQDGDPCLANVGPTMAWSGPSVDAAPPAVVDALRRNPKLVPALARGDRVAEVTFEQRQGLVTTLRFRLFGRDGQLQVQRWDGLIRAADAGPLHLRLVLLAGTAGVSFLFALALFIAFAMRGPFYATSLGAAAMLGGVFLAPLAVTGALWRCGGPKSAFARAQLRIAGVAVLGLTSAAALPWVITRPSIPHAESLLAAGHLAPALAELRALGSDPMHGAEAQRRHDGACLARIRAEHSAVQKWRLVRDTRFLTAEGLENAKRDAFQETERAIEAALATSSPSVAVQFLTAIPGEYERNARARDLRIRAHSAAATQPWQALTDPKRPMDERITQCQEVLTHARAAEELHVTGTHGRSAVVTAPEVAERCAELRGIRARQVAVENERRLRLEQARARQEAERALRAAQARAMAPLVCRDGTFSSSCVCGGSWRGCCSHHGGVSGCSQ